MLFLENKTKILSSQKGFKIKLGPLFKNHPVDSD